MRKPPISDPRDHRFTELHRKDLSRLSRAELAELAAYAGRMAAYVTDRKARRSWTEYGSSITLLMESRC